MGREPTNAYGILVVTMERKIQVCTALLHEHCYYMNIATRKLDCECLK